MKETIERSREFLDALKKAKDKNPDCLVKPKVSMPKTSAPAEKPKADAPRQIEAEFVITEARVQNGMSGGKNTSLILENPEGKRALAYVQGAHPELKRGMGLVNVKKELKQRDSVVFYLLSDYECLEQNAA